MNVLRKIGWATAAIAVVAALAVIGVWGFGQLTGSAVAQTATYSSTETITVVGQGSVQIQPDVAQVSIGVETSAPTVSEAVDENDSKMQAILDALKALGVADKDIQTMNYSIQLNRYPEAAPLPGATDEAAQPVYQVSNMANVTIRNLDKVGDVLDAVVEAGANSIWGVSFSLDDPKPAQEEARVKAIADAEARAGALAELTGVTLGPVMSVSEVMGAGIPSPVVVERAAMGGGSISPGEVEISYQVQVSYFIER